MSSLDRVPACNFTIASASPQVQYQFCGVFAWLGAQRIQIPAILWGHICGQEPLLQREVGVLTHPAGEEDPGVSEDDVGESAPFRVTHGSTPTGTAARPIVVVGGPVSGAGIRASGSVWFPEPSSGARLAWRRSSEDDDAESVHLL